MTDFRLLCVELTDCLEKADWPHRYKGVFQQWTDIAHAALADPEPEGLTPQPIPVTERLPGPEDCDAWEQNHPISNMWCWWWDSNEDVWVRDEADTLRPSYLTHWLPAHALPLPS